MLLVDQDIGVTELAKNYIQDSCHIVYTTSYTILAIEYYNVYTIYAFSVGEEASNKGVQ